eukprot:scaffold1876_cov257-Pinguiococcus_pyrenoidosus.AAC.5
MADYVGKKGQHTEAPAQHDLTVTKGIKKENQMPGSASRLPSSRRKSHQEPAARARFLACTSRAKDTQPIAAKRVALLRRFSRAHAPRFHTFPVSSSPRYPCDAQR